jgi:hypothetical protein
MLPYGPCTRARERHPPLQMVLTINIVYYLFMCPMSLIPSHNLHRVGAHLLLLKKNNK